MDGSPGPDHTTEIVQALLSKLVASESYQNLSEEWAGRGTKAVVGYWGISQDPFQPIPEGNLDTYLHGAIESPRSSHSGQGLAEHFQLFMGAVEIGIYFSLQGQQCNGLGCITSM